MQTVIDRDLLALMVSRAIAAPFYASRTTLPVLQNVYLEAEADRFTVVGYNLEQAIKLTTPITSMIQGAITVPGKLLADLLRYMPADQPVTLTLTEKTMTLTLTAGASRHTLKGIDPEAYPVPPSPDSEPLTGTSPITTTLEMPAALLASTLNGVSHAISSDLSRQVLTCLETTIRNGKIAFAATDGYRLAMRIIDSEDTDADVVIIPPLASINALTTLLASAPKKATVTLTTVTDVDNPRFFAAIEDPGAGITTTISMSLVAHRFPDYRAIIPKSSAYTTTISTTSLIRAINAAALYARDNANIIRITVKPPQGDMGATLGTFIVSAISAEMGSTEEAIDAEVDGLNVTEEFSASFNAKYLLDTLKTLGSPKATLRFTQPTRPCIITAEPQLNDSDIDVIMPMHPPK